MFHTSHLMFHVSHFTFHVSCFMFHTSRFMLHVSYFTLDVSCFTLHVSCFMLHVMQCDDMCTYNVFSVSSMLGTCIQQSILFWGGLRPSLFLPYPSSPLEKFKTYEFKWKTFQMLQCIITQNFMSVRSEV